MALRYRKRIKIIDGLYANLSKNGLSSFSIGQPGSIINVGKNKTSVSVGLPGTGLSYRKHLFSSSSGGNDDIADNNDLRMEAELIVQRCDEALQERRETHDRLINLNEEISFSSFEEYWGEWISRVDDQYRNIRPLKISQPENATELKVEEGRLDIFSLASTISKSPGEFIFFVNNPTDYNIPLPDGFLNIPQSIFGEIYVGSGMIHLKDLDENSTGGMDSFKEFTIGLNLNEFKINDSDLSRAKRYLFSYRFLALMFILGSFSLTFAVPGFWATLIGIISGIFSLKYLFKNFWIFGTAAKRNVAIVYKIADRCDLWDRELMQEKEAVKNSVIKFKESVVGGSHESIVNSTFLIGSSKQLQFLANKNFGMSIDVGIFDNEVMGLLLELPCADKVEVRNKITPGGKVSVQEKTNKELNEEYARIVLNLTFLTVIKCYSAYPTLMGIKVCAYTKRVEEVTGKIKDEFLLYFDTKRDHLSGLDFTKANIIKLTEHLGYRLNFDKDMYLNKIKIDDQDINELISDVLTEIKKTG